MKLIFKRLAMLVIGLVMSQGFVQADFIDDENARLEKVFQAADTNGDDAVDLAEYLKRGKNVKQLTRDFKLFDFDKNQKLSKAEFSCTPGVIHPSLRGPVPDPVEGLRLAALDALNESSDDWRKTPERSIKPYTFAKRFLKSIAPDYNLGVSVSVTECADPDQNGQVTWEEAKRFIDIQLGIRSHDGVLLREPSGRVLLYDRFVAHDSDRDDQISRQEFLATTKLENAVEVFERGDIDGDGFMTVEETAHPRWIGFMDPIMEFRYMDTDFDGLVSLKELKANTNGLQEALIPNTIPPFDANSDGKLSLSEYRMSLMANPICPWGDLIPDWDRDQKLLFPDFVDHYYKHDCQLLWMFYFNHFDTNGDHALDIEEFNFRIIPLVKFRRLSRITGKFEVIFEDRRIPNCGAPEVSPDGTLILFDDYGYHFGATNFAQVYRMRIDGSNVQKLGHGLMPTWSPDEQRFACTRVRDGQYEVWMMNLDGTPIKKISAGLGAQWSPDGKYISFISFSKGQQIILYDVENELFRVAFANENDNYSYFYWNMCWSPDSSRIAIRCIEQPSSKAEIISFDIRQGKKLDLRVHLSRRFSDDELNPTEANLAWYPDGKHLLIPLKNQQHKHRLPYKLSIDEGSKPELPKHIDVTLSYNGAAFSPDGQWVVFPTVREPWIP